MRLSVTLLCLVLLPGVAYTQTKLELSLSTQNLYRGLRQTASGPTFSGSLDYMGESGFYAGIWASRVKFERPFDERDSEIDYYLGYQRQLQPNFAIDFGVTRSTYHGDSTLNYDWTEYYLNTVIRDRWLLTLGVGDGWLGREHTSLNAALTYRHPISETLTTDLTIGHQEIKRLLGFNYQYASAGLVKSWRAFDVRCAYSTTHNATRFGTNAASRWELQVSWVFDR